MRKPYICFLTGLLSLILVASAIAGELQPGSFSLSREGSRYWLVANQAKANAVLNEIATLEKITIEIDPNDDSTVSLNLKGLSLEKLLKSVSQNHAVVYIEDQKTKDFRIERIVTIGAADESSETTSEEKELNGAEVVRAIIDRAAGIERFHQKTAMSLEMMGNRMIVEGEMWADGNKIRLESIIPPTNMKQIFVSDGTTAHTYLPMMKLAQRMDLKRIEEAVGNDFNMGTGGFGSGTNPFSGIDPESFQYAGTEELNGETMYVMEGKVSAPNEQMSQMMTTVPDTAAFWVSTGDGMPRQIIFYGKNGRELYSQQYQDVSVNTEIENRMFEFEMPEGAQVVDMTDGIINMFMELGKKPGSKKNTPEE